MKLNTILTSLGGEGIESLHHEKILLNEIAGENTGASRDSQARYARSSKAKGNVVKDKVIPSSAQGVDKGKIKLLWLDKLDVLGEGKSEDDLVQLPASSTRLVRDKKNAGNVDCELEFISIDESRKLYVQKCYPKYFNGNPDIDSDIGLYVDMHKDPTPSKGPIDIKNIAFDMEGRGASPLGHMESKIKQATGYSTNGVIPRWTGTSGGVTFKIANLLFEMTGDYLQEVAKEDREKIFELSFDWNELQRKIHGILISADQSYNAYAISDTNGYISNGINSIIQYKYSNARNKKFIPPKIPDLNPIPFSLTGKINDVVYSKTLAEFFAFYIVKNLQAKYLYKNDENITNAKYLADISLSISPWSETETASEDGNNNASTPKVDTINPQIPDVDTTTVDDSSFSEGVILRNAFNNRLTNINEKSNGTAMMNAFAERLNIINEKNTTGRGLGLQTSVAIRDVFRDAMKFISYDVLNKSTHRLFSIEPYEFNNYYSLDLRIDTDILLGFFGEGKDTYNKIFKGLYPKEYDTNLKNKILRDYTKIYQAAEGESNLKVDGKNKFRDPSEFKSMSLEKLKRPNTLGFVYEEIPVVSVFIDDGEELITIKQDEFVDLIMSGLSSAIRGHVPQGITIEEILEGKFSRKAITPDQGTFINRVKDPTSDKEFDFRSWSSSSLSTIHTLIMKTFKLAPSLKTDSSVDKRGHAFTRDSILLYITQDDFHQLEKGGQGLSKLSKGILSNLKQASYDLDW